MNHSNRSKHLAQLIIATLVCGLLAAGSADAKVTGAVHRGGRTEAPENTLATFARTLEIGSQWMETDSWLSSDGVLVIHHDIDLCRTTDIENFGFDCVNPLNNPLGRFPRPKDFTLAELKQLDAGSWFDPAFAGEQIPTVAEALQLVNGTGYSLLIEIKTGGQAAKYAQILQETGVSPDSLVVWNRQQRSINQEEFRAFLPDVRRIVGGFAASDLTDEVLDDLSSNGDFGVGVLTNTGVTQELIDQIHSYGLFVYGYPGATGNMPLLQQIELGMDIIHYTNPQWWFDTLQTLPCVDGIDNDGDGFADFVGVDANFNGLLDLLPDLGCKSRLSSTELGQCQDGSDNDGDGLVDFPDDPGCNFAWADSEVPPPSCGLLGIELLLVAPALLARRRRRGKADAGA